MDLPEVLEIMDESISDFEDPEAQQYANLAVDHYNMAIRAEYGLAKE